MQERKDPHTIILKIVSSMIGILAMLIGIFSINGRIERLDELLHDHELEQTHSGGKVKFDFLIRNTRDQNERLRRLEEIVWKK